MNRTTLIIVGLILLVLVGAFVFFQIRGQSIPEDVNMVANDTQSGNEPANVALNAFEGSGSVKCTYQEETTNVTAYIKKGMVKIESTGEGETQYGNVIIKNDTLWTWETDGTNGFTMENISSYRDSEAAGQYGINPDEVRKQITESNTVCNEENIPDGTFDVPSNINFQNFSSMMEGMEG